MMVVRMKRDEENGEWTIILDCFLHEVIIDDVINSDIEDTVPVSPISIPPRTEDTMASPFVLPSQGPAAIPIVAPTTEEKPPSKGATPVKNNSSSKRTCRNIIIHGYCKYEGKGCEFNHDIVSPCSIFTLQASSVRTLFESLIIYLTHFPE